MNFECVYILNLRFYNVKLDYNKINAIKKHNISCCRLSLIFFYNTRSTHLYDLPSYIIHTKKIFKKETKIKLTRDKLYI